MKPAPEQAPDFPTFPPGFRRRILVEPRPVAVYAAVEDEVHRFSLTIHHDGDRITRIVSAAERIPYTTCPAATDFLERKLAGERLDQAATHDIKLHCTHLFELAVVACHYAKSRDRRMFDMTVADRVDARTTACLSLDDDALMLWHLDGITIAGPEPWQGKDLRKLRQWRDALSPDERIHAMMLRSAVLVSGVRGLPPGLSSPPGGIITSRQGACFTHQPDQQPHARSTGERRIDFAASDKAPLADLTDSG